MATVSRRMQARPAEVYAVLADGWSYAAWVVGASRIRTVDPGWPAVGMRIHHSVGVWPLLINDNTEVLAVTPERELVLRARGWPAGEATVRFLLSPAGTAATDVTIEEDVTSGPGRLLPPPVRTALLVPRNTETLRRLALLVEKGAGHVPG